jgi:hypothetical protein
LNVKVVRFQLYGSLQICGFIRPTVHVARLHVMLRMISPKALIVSNLAHWLFIVVGMILAMVLYYAGVTLASDGTASSKVISDQVRSSAALAYVTAFMTIIASSLAGYIGARMAPQAKLLNGALSISLWFIFDIYVSIRGIGGDSHVHIPFLLDFLTSHGAVIPALAGAYLGKLQASAQPSAAGQPIPAAATPMPPQREMAAVPSGAAPTQAKRRTYAGAGIGTFIFIVSQLLLSKHEQNFLFIGLLVVIGLMIATAWVVKTLKGARSRHN